MVTKNTRILFSLCLLCLASALQAIKTPPSTPTSTPQSSPTLSPSTPTMHPQGRLTGAFQTTNSPQTSPVLQPATPFSSPVFGPMPSIDFTQYQGISASRWAQAMVERAVLEQGLDQEEAEQKEEKTFTPIQSQSTSVTITDSEASPVVPTAPAPSPRTSNTLLPISSENTVLITPLSISQPASRVSPVSPLTSTTSTTTGLIESDDDREDIDASPILNILRSSPQTLGETGLKPLILALLVLGIQSTLQK